MKDYIRYLRDEMRYFIKIILVVVFSIFLFAGLSHAEKVTFVKEYTYQASELDSKASCRTISLEMVKRLLLEELGTYLISETEVKDFKLTKEQVKTYSAGIVGAEIIEDKWDGKTYWLKAKVSADPKEVAKALKKIMDEPFKGKELEETRKKAEELTKEVERLNKELAKANNKQPSKKIQQEYKATIQGLTAVEWFNKGYEAASAERWKEALDAYTKAIELKPDYGAAYFIRGRAYLELGNHQQAINEFSKAIELMPDYIDAYYTEAYYAEVYYSRGVAYSKLGNYQQAINDFSKAIELMPDYANAHHNRGVCYAIVGNHQQAINDCTKAIELKPDHARAYFIRGSAYNDLGNYQQATKDYQIAARLGYKLAQEFLREKGISW
ncbi:MAG: tetratricopeptide repeat protein [Nitrospirae bacterium]|nr:tetratricopeptide repeat protein [Nitrospirota bacterium]